MDYPISSSPQLAVLGGKSAFPAGESIPLICPQGYGYQGEFSAVDAILRNEPNEESKARASQQRFVTKVLPGVEASSLGFRAQLQARIGNFLELDPETISGRVFNKPSAYVVGPGFSAFHLFNIGRFLICNCVR